MTTVDLLLVTVAVLFVGLAFRTADMLTGRDDDNDYNNESGTRPDETKGST